MNGLSVNRRRKQIARRKAAFLISTTLVIVFVIGILCGTLFTKARDEAEDMAISYKYFTNIEVQEGDSLWDIGKEYITEDYSDLREYVNEICEINSLSSEVIYHGQYITVPYYSNEFM